MNRPLCLSRLILAAALSGSTLLLGGLPANATAHMSLIPASATDLVDQIEQCKTGAANNDGVMEICNGLQTGVIAGIVIYARLIERPVPFCLPTTTKDRDIDDAIVSYVKETGAGDWPAVPAIVAAMTAKFPCPQTGASPPHPTPGKPSQVQPSQTQPVQVAPSAPETGLVAPLESEQK
jgi:hypothetical protein